MSEETKNMNTEEQPVNSTPEDKGGQGGEKMFTQEEVNRIVAERLARERAKGQSPAPDQREQELTQKEQELTQREQLAACREYLEKEGLPTDLADLLGAKPLPAFKDTVRGILTAISRSERRGNNHTVQMPEKQTADSLFRKAFGLSRKE